MSSERLPGSNPERAKNAGELEKSGAERLKELQEKLEKRAEESTAEKKDVESAKNEALKLAQDKPEADPKPSIENQQEIRPITKHEKDQAFDDTMKSIRKDMNPAERTFSKVIHNPVIDKASQAVGSTIARPNLILGGAIGTIVVSAIVYFIANRYGYPLSGFEAIGAFILGWIIGALVEYLRVGFSGKP